MLLVTGKIERVQTRQAGREPETWTEHTLVVRDWGQTLYVTAAKDFVESGLPNEGEMVALDVSVRSYLGRDNKPGHGYTAFRRNSEAESALFGSEQAKPLRAAQ
jgi:hypothetical protein